MKNKQRVIGIDIVKAMACIFVILLHTSMAAFLRDGVALSHTMPSQIIYYLGTGAVPLFFMANAFFIINRPEISYKYIYKKIIAILIPVFLWNALLFLGYMMKGKETNYIYLVFGSLIQRGFFFQFWFLGALIVLLLFAPILNNLLKKSLKFYVCVFIIFCLICYIIDGTNHIYFKTPIQANVIQTFRIWTWFAYYLLGGLIGHVYRVNKNILVSKYLAIGTFTLTIVSLTYSILNTNWIHSMYAEFNYDNFVIMAWITIAFIFILSFKNISPQKRNLIELVSSNSMGIYIIHVPVLKIFEHFMMIDNLATNLIAIVVVFGGSLLISYLISRIPLINYFVKL